MSTQLQLYVYMGSALAGLLVHWIYKAREDQKHPSAVEWTLANWRYVLGSLALTLGSALFFMPDTLGVNANAAAVAFGLAGGSAIRNIFTPAK